MRRTVDDFRKMSIPDLHDEIMQISSGNIYESPELLNPLNKQS